MTADASKVAYLKCDSATACTATLKNSISVVSAACGASSKENIVDC